MLEVQTHDDHMKDSHQCMAEYRLHITPPDGREEGRETGDGFANSIAGWGRRLSVHLNGFSKDGQHVFGVISEAASTRVFKCSISREVAPTWKLSFSRAYRT